MILKKLSVLLASLFVLFFVGIGLVNAANCTTAKNGWIVCDNGNGGQTRATSCDQLSGKGTETCGAGSGCGLTGCYNCASQGNCNGFGNTPSGNTCPQGQVWDSCKTGSNTCVPGEKWSDCKTGSNTLTNCRQERDSCRTCSNGRNEFVCTAGNAPTYGCIQCRTIRECTPGTQFVCTSTSCSWEWSRADADWVYYCSCSGGYEEDGCFGGEYDCQPATCGGECLGGSVQWKEDCTDPCFDSGATHTVCDGSNTCVGGYSWDNCANGGVNSCQGGCVPLPCNSTAPSTPGLTSPTSGAQISGTETSLAGATAGWGTACSGQNYQFNIYVQQCDAIMTPTTLWKTVAASGNNFNELFTGVGGKGYCWTAEATNGVTTSAKATAQRFIFSDQPWWQVSGGSVMTFGGVTSLVGKNQKFIADTPGVVISGTGSVFLNGQDANANKWVATDANLSQKVSYRYDYDFVSRRIISTIRPNVGPNFVATSSQLMVEPAQDYGIYWTKVTGDLDIVDNLDFGSNKVVVLVEGNANIKGKINFTKNEGLFALYVNGNINIDPSIGTVSGTGVNPNGLPTHLEGLYLAQGAINTGVAASQLRLEGAFIGIGGVNLQRNLNSAWPSEYFVFRPDILMNLPKQLLRQNHIWQELAP